MNKFKLAKEFKAFFAVSPIDYLIGRRLESAAKLLFTTERSVTEVAADVCMENVSYFVRRFGKHTA
jgi:iron complex transport system substrate-binding protein